MLLLSFPCYKLGIIGTKWLALLLLYKDKTYNNVLYVIKIDILLIYLINNTSGCIYRLCNSKIIRALKLFFIQQYYIGDQGLD